MFTFFFILFGKIQEQDLTPHLKNSQAFRFQNIAASASNAKDAAMHMNSLQDLTKALSEQQLGKYESNIQKIGDYHINNFWKKGDKILIEYYKKENASFVIQAYLHDVKNVQQDVTDKVLAYFYTLVTSLQDQNQWQQISTPKNQEHSQIVQDLKRKYEEAKQIPKKDDDNEYIAARLARHEVETKYLLAGLNYFDDLDTDAQKSVVSQVMWSNAKKTNLLFPRMKEKFVSTACEILKDTAVKSVMILPAYLPDPYSHNQNSPINDVLLAEHSTESLHPQLIETLAGKTDIQKIEMDGIKIDKALISTLRDKKDLIDLDFYQCFFSHEAVEEYMKILPTLFGVNIREQACKFQSKAVEESFEKVLVK